MRTLNLIEKAFLLKKSSLFGALDLDLLLSISDKMELLTFKMSEKVFHYNQDAHRMYLIVEGLIAIRDKNEVLLAELQTGDFFGDEALFSKKPRAYMAVAQNKSLLLALSRSHLLSIIEECPSVAVAFLEAYTEESEFRKGHPSKI